MSTLYVNKITPQAGDTVGLDAKLVVSGSTELGDEATDVTKVVGQLTASNGCEVQGDLVVKGDVEIEGTLNAITHHETDLFIKDKTITIASGSNESATDGAGINFGGSSDTPIATFLFDADSLGSTTSHLVSSTGLKVTGDFQATTNITASQGLLVSNHITADDGAIAFAGVSTFTHCVTASSGLKITGDVVAVTNDNKTDLGASGAQFKDLYVNGIGYIDQLGTDGDPVTVYVNAGELDGVTLGGEALVTATNIDINSGSIDACTVGANTPLAGTFTTLTANGNVTLGDGVGDVTTVTGQLTASNGLKVDASNLLVDEKVGIGTTSPSSNLEIEGSSGDLIFEIDNNASNSANFQIQNGAGRLALATPHLPILLMLPATANSQLICELVTTCFSHQIQQFFLWALEQTQH